MPTLDDYKFRSCKTVFLEEHDPFMQEIMSNEATGQRLIVQGRSDLPDGHYEVEETLPPRNGTLWEAHLYPLIIFE
jgi:hypothetical protein